MKIQVSQYTYETLQVLSASIKQMKVCKYTETIFHISCKISKD